MTIEDKLKNLILSRYKSVREFVIAIDMPYTTIDSMFKRGIGTSSVSNVIKICKALSISADALANGEIEPSYNRSKNTIEIKDVIEDAKEILTHGNVITLDGKPIDKHEVESIIDAMDVGIEIAKKRQKF